METEDFKQNIKLGAFVFAGTLLFLVALFYIGRENTLFNRTFTISAVFKNIEGLKEGDKVWLSGVKIGTIKHVQIVSEGQVVVAMSLRDKQNEFIKKDATAFIGSDGLVGNKIVVIRPGNAAAVVQDSDTINTFSPTDTQELINLAKDVGGNMRSLTDDIKTITSRIHKGEGLVGELLVEGPVSSELRDVVHSLKSAGQNTNRATADLTKMIAQINTGDGLASKLISDTTYAYTFEQALDNVAAAGANTKAMTEELRVVIGKLNNSDNAVNVLLADSVFANQLKVTLSNAESASAKLDSNMLALKHNFLLKGYFKKQEKKAAKAKAAQTKAAQQAANP